MMLLEFSMIPMDKGESVSDYVARTVKIIDESGLDYRLHSMGTVVEGELKQLLDLLEKCFSELQTDCDRISCTAKFDYRKDGSGRLDAKVASVEQKVGRELKK